MDKDSRDRAPVDDGKPACPAASARPSGGALPGGAERGRRRILVMPHDLAIGGSQINAIDLAAGVARAGHEVAVFGVRGPLVDLIHDRGLEFIDAHALSWRPAPTRIAQLVALSRRRRFDLIHAYEWSTCLDAFFGPHLCLGMPVLCTVLSMDVSPLVPSGIPLVMGTDELADEARRRHAAPVWTLEPPIDTDLDHPAIDGAAFRRRMGVADDEFLIATVSRLALDIKIDALVRAVDAMQDLAGTIGARLVVVGGGQAADALRARADAVNRRVGRDAILFAGPLLDPRPAYAAADLVLGMGSSALRALAIGRPVVVQGLDGFSAIFAPETLSIFLHQGFFGMGDGASGADRLARQVAELYHDPTRRAALGTFGRSVVTGRFSLSRGIDATLRIYEDVLRAPPRRRPGDALVAGWRALRQEFDNHDPRQKRRLATTRQALLHAVESSASWPPGAPR